jgi:poly(3-hydroxybutyrate) depolymerase
MRRHPSLLLLCMSLVGAATLARATDDPWREPVDVAFTSRCDGSEQKYVLMLPVVFDRNESVALMVALHGHGSDRWQFVQEKRDECRALRDAAVRSGMIFVAPDYRAKTSWMGPKAEADLLQILDELQKEYRISH